jgi:hypothetical protein
MWTTEPRCPKSNCSPRAFSRAHPEKLETLRFRVVIDAPLVGFA